MPTDPHTRSANIAIYIRSCWLAGYTLEDGLIDACRKSGATDAEIAHAVSIYASAEHALQRCGIVKRGAHLDRRAS